MLMKNPRLLAGSEAELIGGQREVTSMCGICPAGCGVKVHLTQGKIERMEPLRGHPQGIICPRGARAKEVVYSPDRLLHPQLRGASGKLRRVGWDEAFDWLVDRLKGIAASHGPEALGTYSGRGNFEFGLNEHFAPAGSVESCANAVLAPFGSPNVMGVGALCYASNGMIAPRATFGGALRNTRVDLEGAAMILVWGANPATDSPPINLRRVKRAAKAGAKVVVIDHRRTDTVRATGAEWIAVRPGSDGALALGLMQVLIAEGLYDEAFVARWTHGFDELREYVTGFTPERVAQITGVPAARVRSLGRELGRAGSLSVLMYTGLEYSNCGVQANRAVWSLQALTGKLDTPGSTQLRELQPQRTARLLTELPTGGRPPLGSGEHPLFFEARHEAHAGSLPRAILEGEPYPFRGLIISGASMITSWPDPGLWRRALSALDLLVVVDRFPTADSEYAQLILPATTLFETESYMVYDDGWVQLRQRVIPPLGEARNDYLIFAELARRLGYGDRWPQTEQAMIEHALEPTGVTLQQLREHPEGLPLKVPPRRYRKYERGELRADGAPGFETPTGKFELASEWLRSHGADPLPIYTEPVEGPLADPELGRRYPLVLNTGSRTQFAFRSQHLNIPSLISKQPHPLAMMHEDDAEARGIVDGDEVEVSTRRARVRFVARVGRDVTRGAVEANMGGGGPLGPAAWRRANVNALTDGNNKDPLSGFPVFKALLCEVCKYRPRRP